METFICKVLNTATRIKDETKIINLGPFAQVLRWILCYAEDKKAKTK